eukprot:1997544-Prorocentrum_lima.AAC.1
MAAGAVAQRVSRLHNRPVLRRSTRKKVGASRQGPSEETRSKSHRGLPIMPILQKRSLACLRA